MFGTVGGKLLPSGNDDEALNLCINVLGESDMNFAMDIGPNELECLVKKDAYVLGVVGTAAMTGKSSRLVQDDEAHLFVLHVQVHDVTRLGVGGDVTALDETLRRREVAFWLIHWYGAFVGDVLLRSSSSGKSPGELLHTALDCFEKEEPWSVSPTSTASPYLTWLLSHTTDPLHA